MQRFFILVAVMALCITSSNAAELDKTKLGKITSRMQQFVEDQTLAGAVMVVGTADGIVFQDAVGSMSLESKTPMSKDTLFRIASMTKPMTAAAIMILADEGKLKPEDLVEKHLPEFRGQMLKVTSKGKGEAKLQKPKRPITLADLMTHTSGLPSGYPKEAGDVYGKRHITLKESIEHIAKQPLNFEPGTQWSYCNSGIDTLGRVVEVVSGMSYEDFMKKRIFEPLEMKNSTFHPTKEQYARTAELYGQKDGKLVATPNVLLGAPGTWKHPVPAGGLYSTGADVAQFYRMMLAGGTLNGKKILSAESVKELTTIHTGDLRSGFVGGSGFGYGFAVVKKPEGVTATLSEGSFGHGGAFGTQSWADPKKGVFMILLIGRTGLKNGDASEMRKELQRLTMESLKN
jgi:CubicO group peptidase (beta-lactamase class C family)